LTLLSSSFSCLPLFSDQENVRRLVTPPAKLDEQEEALRTVPALYSRVHHLHVENDGSDAPLDSVWFGINNTCQNLRSISIDFGFGFESTFSDGEVSSDVVFSEVAMTPDDFCAGGSSDHYSCSMDQIRRPSTADDVGIQIMRRGSVGRLC
jgi:hypothetical protein